MIIKKSNLSLTFLLISIFIAIISQIPIYDDIIMSEINSALWIVTILLCFFNKKEKFCLTNRGFLLILISAIILVFNSLMLCFNIYDKNPTILRVLLLPIIIYMIGNNVEDNYINKITNIFIISSVILALWINFNYFRSLSDWFSSYSYLYARKNSAGQILSTSIILLINNLNSKKIIKIILSLYLFLVICLMQCRTAVISLAFALLIFIYKNSKHKIKLTLLLLICAIILTKVPIVNTFMGHTFLIDKYSESSLNTFSSNRLDFYYDAISSIKSNLLFGTGNYYVDNFFLNVLANFGIIFGGMYVIFTILIFINNILKNTYDKSYKKVLYYLTFYYIMTSLLEGYPPYGPGTCTLIFWLFSGLYDGNYSKIKLQEE